MITITQSDFNILDTALLKEYELQKRQADLDAEWEANRATLETLVSKLTAQSPDGKSPVPGVTIADVSDVIINDDEAFKYVTHPDNMAACSKALKVKGDAIAVLVGLALQHPEFNLSRVFSLDTIGYKAMVRNGVIAGLPHAGKVDQKRVSVSLKAVKVGLELVELFNVQPDPEPEAESE